MDGQGWDLLNRSWLGILAFLLPFFSICARLNSFKLSSDGQLDASIDSPFCVIVKIFDTNIPFELHKRFSFDFPS